MFPAKKAAACLQHATLCALTCVSLLCPPLASANTAPTISGSPARSVMVHHAYAFQPSARDADHDRLTFSVSHKPWWATFNRATGRLSGTPGHTATFDNIGICVSDGRYRRCLPAFALKVVGPGASPVISGTPPAAVTAGNAYSFRPTAHDPNGLPMTYEIFDKPNWLNFNHTTGQVSGTPTAADVGEYGHIGITVSDGYHQAALTSFSITVNSGGAQLPPGNVTISWTPPTENTNGTALTNLAGYHLYYGTSQSSLNQKVNITNAGLASYVVSNLTAGTWYFTLTAVNSLGVESPRSAILTTSVE
ncbi:MAG TPA: putative Ig domain-containing protein [Steroidobacteraceae bacterium]|nr:putative Ig domain-containing protein [Steroidobacteraceae bacterium]